MQICNEYQFKILSKGEADYFRQSVECLTSTFVGMNIADKLVQEPILGYLRVSHDVFYAFVKDYMNAVVDQGYCSIAITKGRVVGVLACDTYAPAVEEYYEYQSFLSVMNVVKFVINDVSKRFMDDYAKKHGKTMCDGEVLHLFMLGVSAERNRHYIVNQLVHKVLNKAAKKGLKLAFGEATNPKSMTLLERYVGMSKYRDINGNPIVHTYEDDKLLRGIPKAIADGVYVIARNLENYLSDTINREANSNLLKLQFN